MRPIVVRALTVALATTGVAWAIALPSLTLGEVKPPSHAFAIPAPGGDVVIEASRLATPAFAQPARIARHTIRRAPTRAIIVVSAPAPSTAPRTSSRPAAPAPKPVPTAVPQAPPAPTPTPAPQPQPQPAPQPQPQPAPEPPVRALALAVVAEQPTEVADDDSVPPKRRKDKPHKEKKPKHDKARKNDVELPQAAPPAAEPVTPVASVVPVVPVAVDEADQDGSARDEAGEDNDGKEHGSHGKGHDKKK